MRVQIVPDQDDRAAELLVCGVQQAGVVSLVEALAPTFGGAAVEVDAVDQPGPVAGLGADQRSRGDTLGARGGDPNDGRMATATPGAAFGRPQPLAGFVLEAEPAPRSAAVFL